MKPVLLAEFISICLENLVIYKKNLNLTVEQECLCKSKTFSKFKIEIIIFCYINCSVFVEILKI